MPRRRKARRAPEPTPVELTTDHNGVLQWLRGESEDMPSSVSAGSGLVELEALLSPAKRNQLENLETLEMLREEEGRGEGYKRAVDLETGRARIKVSPEAIRAATTDNDDGAADGDNGEDSTETGSGEDGATPEPSEAKKPTPDAKKPAPDAKKPTPKAKKPSANGGAAPVRRSRYTEARIKKGRSVRKAPGPKD